MRVRANTSNLTRLLIAVLTIGPVGCFASWLTAADAPQRPEAEAEQLRLSEDLHSQLPAKTGKFEFPSDFEYLYREPARDRKGTWFIPELEFGNCYRRHVFQKVSDGEIIPLCGYIYQLRDIDVGQERGITLRRLKYEGDFEKLFMKPDSLAIRLGDVAQLWSGREADRDDIKVDRLIHDVRDRSVAIITSAVTTSVTHNENTVKTDTIAVSEGDTLRVGPHLLTVLKIVAPDRQLNVAGWVEFSHKAELPRE